MLEYLAEIYDEVSLTGLQHVCQAVEAGKNGSLDSLVQLQVLAPQVLPRQESVAPLLEAWHLKLAGQPLFSPAIQGSDCCS